MSTHRIINKDLFRSGDFRRDSYEPLLENEEETELKVSLVNLFIITEEK